MSDIKINENELEEIQEREQCFVIMPIGDHPSHEKGHFTKIYRDLIKPAIEDAGFIAYRADENGGSQNIQIDIIKKIIEAPMAICDLSTRNPNVLFELGIRQAFDLPVALIQEVGTERIFDINTFNTGEYRSARIFDEVMHDREKIRNLIKTTYKKHNDGDGINSIIRLIPALNKAKLSDKEVSSNELVKIMFNQINNLSDDISILKRELTITNVFNKIDYGKKRMIDMLDELTFEEEKIFMGLSGYGDVKYTLRELAEMLNMSMGQVRNEYYKILERLRMKGIDTESFPKYPMINKVKRISE